MKERLHSRGLLQVCRHLLLATMSPAPHLLALPLSLTPSPNQEITQREDSLLTHLITVHWQPTTWTALALLQQFYSQPAKTVS